MFDFFDGSYFSLLAELTGVRHETTQGREGDQDGFVGEKRRVRGRLFMENLHDFQVGRFFCFLLPID